MARCFLQAKDLSMKFWAEVVYCSNYLLNQISTRAICHVTLVEKWCGKNPSVNHLRTFGCVAWEHISNQCRNKLDAKSHACIMMRYSKESNDLLNFLSNQITNHHQTKHNIWWEYLWHWVVEFLLWFIIQWSLWYCWIQRINCSFHGYFDQFIDLYSWID